MSIYVYPCDRGGSFPVGYHQFTYSNGHIICAYRGYEKPAVTFRGESR